MMLFSKSELKILKVVCANADLRLLLYRYVVFESVPDEVERYIEFIRVQSLVSNAMPIRA